MDDVLLKAAQILDERGWCQGSLRDSEGRVCIAGAVRLALFGQTISLEYMDYIIYREKLKSIQKVLYNHPLGPLAIPFFNDKIAETKEECVKLLMEAAEIDE